MYRVCILDSLYTVLCTYCVHCIMYILFILNYVHTLYAVLSTYCVNCTIFWHFLANIWQSSCCKLCTLCEFLCPVDCPVSSELRLVPFYIHYVEIWFYHSLKYFVLRSLQVGIRTNPPDWF